MNFDIKDAFIIGSSLALMCYSANGIRYHVGKLRELLAAGVGTEGGHEGHTEAQNEVRQGTRSTASDTVVHMTTYA